MNNLEQLDMLRASKIGAELTPEQSAVLADAGGTGRNDIKLVVREFLETPA